MDITTEEKELLKKYRRLNPHDKGYLEAVIEKLEKEKKRYDFKICKKKGERK